MVVDPGFHLICVQLLYIVYGYGSCGLLPNPDCIVYFVSFFLVFFLVFLPNIIDWLASTGPINFAENAMFRTRPDSRTLHMVSLLDAPAPQQGYGWIQFGYLGPRVELSVRTEVIVILSFYSMQQIAAAKRDYTGDSSTHSTKYNSSMLTPNARPFFFPNHDHFHHS